MAGSTEWWLSTGPRGLLLRVLDWNPAASRLPVVVLHGFLEQGAAWHRVAASLAAGGGRVLAPDQRGHGRSGHVGSGGFYHFWDYVSDLDALVSHVGGRIDLVGHSMGGTVAGLFAGSRPECVRRLVLIEGLGPPDTTDQAVERARRFLADRRRGPSHAPVRNLRNGVDRMRSYNPNISPDVATGLVRRTVRPDGPELTWTWDPLHRARSPVPFQAELFCRFLREVSAPTLVIRGGASTFAPSDEEARLACLGNARVVEIAGAGHLVHHDAPEELAVAIQEHIA